MSTPVRASDRDLRALARIVSEDRADLPDGQGLPPSLLADLMGQIRCDVLSLDGWDPGRQMCWFSQEIPSFSDAPGYEGIDEVVWAHFWDCPACSYAARTGDLHSVITDTDFYSARQWHSTVCYTDCTRPLGMEHSIMAFLPSALPPTVGPGRFVGLTLSRGPGPDFSERDRAVLTLLGPHLDRAFRDVERRRHPVPRLTPRQDDLLRLLAAGHTNTQIARRLGISESTVRTHLEHIYARLGVSSRTAAVTRAFPDRVLAAPGAEVHSRQPGRTYPVGIPDGPDRGDAAIA
jgi:DNA-binding CsgD family transcriptional regulator